MALKFGIEIECLFPVSSFQRPYYDSAKDELADFFTNSGIPTYSAEYGHRRYRNWKIVFDRSVQKAGYHGMEFVSPPINKDNGGEWKDHIKKVSELLISRGAIVNKYCGLHVHVDASDMSIEHAKAIFSRYKLMEDSLDVMFSPSRRGNENSYCMSLKKYEAPYHISRISDILYDRYTKVNFQAYQRHGTIEFRQHQGTVDADKIINWVEYVFAFVDNCKRYAGTTKITKKLPETMVELGMKNRRFLNICIKKFSEINSNSSIIEMIERSPWTLKRKEKAKKIFAISVVRGDAFISYSEAYRILERRLNDTEKRIIARYLEMFKRSLVPMEIREEFPPENGADFREDIFVGIPEDVKSFYANRIKELNDIEEDAA